MSVGLLLLMLAGHGFSPACQKQTIVNLFTVTASGKGTVADLNRLIANQSELEEGFFQCKFFPESEGKPLTAQQEERIREVFRRPADHASECLAYLPHRWPKLFGEKIEPGQVMKPFIEHNPVTIVYPVRIAGQVVHFRFEEASCQILTIQMPNGRSAFEEVDCLWRHKTQGVPKRGGSATPDASEPSRGR